MIKIPDVYRVKMSFKSLLPNNFNNFLYTYSQNVKHMVTYTSPASNTATQEDGQSYETMFMKGIDKYAERLEDQINKPTFFKKLANGVSSAVKNFLTGS